MSPIVVCRFPIFGFNWKQSEKPIRSSVTDFKVLNQKFELQTIALSYGEAALCTPEPDAGRV